MGAVVLVELGVAIVKVVGLRFVVVCSKDLLCVVSSRIEMVWASVLPSRSHCRSPT